MTNEKIIGYTEQTQQQIDYINLFKGQEAELMTWVNELMAGITRVGMNAVPNVDKRWMSIAKTHFQEGFMAAVRSIARPNGD